MYTRCPECHTAFRVTVAQLKARDGLVRCGRCAAVFRADLRLFAAPSTASSIEEITPPAPPPAIAPAESRNDSTSTAIEPTVEPAEIPIISELSLFFPRPKRSVHPALWTTVIGALLLLLAIQFVYFYRDEIAQVAQLKFAMTKFCSWLNCEIMPSRTQTTPELLQTTIAPHPRYANILRIRASLVNRADKVQPLPLMEVSLTGSDGALLARRSFGPNEYLAPPADMQSLTPNVAVHVLLEVSNPDSKASGYEIKLFPSGLGTHH
ncbi:MAG: DUF3426 domain-containing protein [Gammaproteobacteria bacterium]|nr:DUF3426 domain-containing protein [Gammaproteobacteria bacterium]